MPNSKPLVSSLLRSVPQSYAMTAIFDLRRKLQAEGVDIVDLSVGEPSLAPPQRAREELAKAALEGVHHKYPQFKGTIELRSAFSDYYERRYGWRPDPETQVLPLLGSKEGLLNLTRALSGGNLPVYVGGVSYPAYRSSAFASGANIVELGGGWEEGYNPTYPDSAQGEGGLALVSSPANPTGAVFGGDNLAAFIEESRKRRIVLAYDAAYAELSGTKSPVMPLRAHGTDMIIELHSLSKSHSLASWRIGFAVGSAELLGPLARMKSFQDGGVPGPIQTAVANLLPHCDDFVDMHRRALHEQHFAMRQTLDGLPLELFPSPGGMFAWIRTANMDGQAFAAKLMKEGVLVVPGEVFGPGGARCLRVNVSVAPEKLPEVRRRFEIALRDEG